MIDFIGVDNNIIYHKTLVELLSNPVSSYGKHIISHEIIGFSRWFYATGSIHGINDNYAKNEIDWYMSQDRCIKGHKGIEDNPTWVKCSSDNGMVNSNYGWCTMSADNGNQFDHALNHLRTNPDTRQAIMVYIRPSIHVEAFDNEHAKYDMTCTCYVDYLIRADKLYSIVHMRSNDVWFGLRYDLLWQQKMLAMVYMELVKDAKFSSLTLGGIKWNADSLHLYAKHYSKAKQSLEYVYYN